MKQQLSARIEPSTSKRKRAGGEPADPDALELETTPSLEGCLKSQTDKAAAAEPK